MQWFHKHNHMNPGDAVQTFLDLRASWGIPIHFGTFQLTAEPLTEPKAKLREALALKNIPLVTFEALRHGETRQYKNQRRQSGQAGNV